MQKKQFTTWCLILLSILLLGACAENNKNKNLTVESSSAGDIKLLKTKAKVAITKEAQNPLPVPLNPDPDSKKVYLNKDGSGVIVTLDNRIDQFFSLIDFVSYTSIVGCPVQTDKESTTKPLEYIKTISSQYCRTTPNYKAGAIVLVLFVFTALDGDYTLCLLDPKQPDKADCGDGYIKR
ncbi:hypothetical protein [uncultured Gammaproteobacteria bacterium]|jgi:hypothetical protein|uniref:Uncharacterized protein n=2 Tax=sulfur-oxidizing symbionts TaxID=32036 RepID=A0ACA8ZP78_9GAMM|nr:MULTISPECIES: hypothetical protein [sulfur-oxidizing symbionts]CAC9504348.1 hypothetical protein [uncultured Gammaproteobacteria bacterium]CAB5496379.1 hypothetical protein AZO1586R_422 [Bathymodiolus azoricus thioautotrophic gill symbiont]CAB5502484.1 hypothetical protein AZO1586I_967 [Bathymodiolus thermophilus thioautotrophic gill symbiont]CAC9507206.1 hypothetical protein [uncultured Gammaproteobacteria bacterium]CAC9518316.1 hypothetical protein [uncultured Gammaproteobacteria bacteriu